MDRLLLVDGSNLLFQMFFGMPARIVDSQGKAINGVLGFAGALLKIIRMAAPTHMAVFFDGEHENARSAINPDYKANRTDYSQLPEEETPFSQIDDVYAALDLLQIRHTETASCETDDMMASYVLSFGRNAEIMISYLDSDFFQLITDRVSVLRYRGKKTVICGPGYVKEKFGIVPGQYADFKSLTGDASDNIKGAERVGVKTAALLLNEYGTLENILARAGEIKKPLIRESIVSNAERLRKNYKIIKLDNSVSLPFAFKELAYRHTNMTANEVLKGIGIWL